MRIGARLSGVERTLAKQVTQTGDASLSRILQSLQTNRASSRSNTRAAGITDRFQSNRLESQLSRVSSKIDSTVAASSRLGSFRSSIAAVREQVSLIKSAAARDSDGQLTAQGRAEAQSDIDAALSEIGRITGKKIAGRTLIGANGSTTNGNTITGQNVAEVSGVTVTNIRPNRTETISGRVDQAAERATLQLEGDNDGAVKSTANFTVNGTNGSHTFDITYGEQLTAVRDRVNQESDTTGVEALVVDNELVFRTETTGASQSVEIVLNSLEDPIVITGRNEAQVTSFTAANVEPDANVNLTGQVNDAEAATLNYRGRSNGTVNRSGTFELTGNNGSVTFSVTDRESLTGVRDRINLESANTGVTASVSGRNLTFTSNTTGSDAIVEISLVSGRFNVTGGNGDGTANGDDRHAVIRGDRVDASGDGTFTFEHNDGDFTFDFDPGFSGTFDSIRVQRLDAEFDVTGGNGSGRDTGLDGEATINGESVTSSTNSFVVSERRFSATVDFVDGFDGNFDTITVENTFSFEPSERSLGFSVPGVDGQRFASLRLQGIGAAALGGEEGTLNMLATGGGLAGLDDVAQSAIDIADAALTQLDGLLSKIDSFQSQTLDAATAALETEKTGISSSISLLISKIDAAQTAADNRKSLLESNRTSNKNAAISSLFSALDERRESVLSLLSPR